jgi:hypothetical protein
MNIRVSPLARTIIFYFTLQSNRRRGAQLHQQIIFLPSNIRVSYNRREAYFGRKSAKSAIACDVTFKKSAKSCASSA